MGNSFIGFPVPRAKIADMITGTAPPAIHATQHETGGSDVLDGTKIPGAGGVTLPFSDYFYNTSFESLDGIRQSLYAGGTITLDDRYVELATTGTQYSFANLEKRINYPSVPLNWDKNREFRAQVNFRVDTIAGSDIVIGTGVLTAGNSFGFRVENGLLKAFSQAVGNIEVHTIEDWSGSGFNNTRQLRAHKTGANEIKFYVDDVLVYTATTHIPAGSDDIEKVMYMYVYNTDAGGIVWMRLSDFTIWQEA